MILGSSPHFFFDISCALSRSRRIMASKSCRPKPARWYLGPQGPPQGHEEVRIEWVNQQKKGIYPTKNQEKCGLIIKI